MTVGTAKLSSTSSVSLSATEKCNSIETQILVQINKPHKLFISNYKLEDLMPSRALIQNGFLGKGTQAGEDNRRYLWTHSGNTYGMLLDYVYWNCSIRWASRFGPMFLSRMMSTYRPASTECLDFDYACRALDSLWISTMQYQHNKHDKIKQQQ